MDLLVRGGNFGHDAVIGKLQGELTTSQPEATGISIIANTLPWREGATRTSLRKRTAISDTRMEDKQSRDAPRPVDATSAAGAEPNCYVVEGTDNEKACSSVHTKGKEEDFLELHSTLVHDDRLHESVCMNGLY